MDLFRLYVPGVLIWHCGTTVDARATYSGTKHEISGARAWLSLTMQKNAQQAIVMVNFVILRVLNTFKSTTVFMLIWLLQ